MRPIKKGESSKQYSKYQDARDDLFKSIGIYCSYCEMIITNMAEVEHIVPRNKGGEELSWGNFLLSCKYCNTSKSDNNESREGYLWPDMHNTFVSFIYDRINQVIVNNNLTEKEKEYAKNTIELLSLDRHPGKKGWNSHKDMRYISREKAWKKAIECLNDYIETPIPALAKSISKVASSEGHFSIWMEVFKEHNEVRTLIITSFVGTNKEYFNDIIA